MQPTLSIAFVAGILSILSPCILPLIPAYFAYMSGTTTNTSTTDKSTGEPSSKSTAIKILPHAILFALGFSVVFLLFGAVIGSIGQSLLIHKRTIEIVGGIIIILFALQISGIFSKFSIFRILTREKRLSTQTIKTLKKASPLKSLLTGVIFAFGWSPCYGPILGSILTLALVGTNLQQGIILFGVYSLGMTIPLILLALMASKVTTIINKTKTIRKYYGIIMGALLLLLGIGMVTGEISSLANTISNLYINYNIEIF